MPCSRGFTMVEMLVVVTVIALLAGVSLLPTFGRAREQARRCSCGGNCGNMIKCCHLYSDATPNLGLFPVYVAVSDHKSETGDGHTKDGLLAVSQLFDAYVKDHRVFSCSSAPSRTDRLVRYYAPTPPTVANYTHYGYDPGHRPTHATAGVFGDMGALHPTNHANSTNHGRDGPGQNIAIGAGSVEWWDCADGRMTRDALENPLRDRIYADDWRATVFPEELETWIIP